MTVDEIKIDVLKHGLEPVQQAYAEFKKATAARKAAQTSGAELNALFEAEGAAHAAYVDACMVLHGYVRATVNRAEGRDPGQDE
jgi:hypothetical protein